MARLLVRRGLGAGSDGVGRDLDVADGELFVLAGGPLSWSRRLLRAIAGLDDIRLEITVGDRAVGDRPPEQRGIGFVFPEGALFPHLTVSENLGFALVSRNAPRYVIEERLAAVVEVAGIASLLGRRPASLTAIERLRVAVARALMREPAVLLIDDPLSSTNGSSRRALRDELIRLHERARVTVVVSTAESWDAFAIAQRLALHAAGCVRQIGTPAELYGQPADRFVAALAGSPPMNMLTLPVVEGRVSVSGWSLAVPEAPSIVLGLRPEDLLFEEPAVPSLPLRGQVKRVEMEGLLARVLVGVDEHTLQVRCESRRVPDGQGAVTLYCELPRLHLFAADAIGAQLPWEREAPKTVEVVEAERIEARAAAAAQLAAESVPPEEAPAEAPSTTDETTLLDFTPFGGSAQEVRPPAIDGVDPVAEPFNEPPLELEPPEALSTAEEAAAVATKEAIEGSVAADGAEPPSEPTLGDEPPSTTTDALEAPEPKTAAA